MFTQLLTYAKKGTLFDKKDVGKLIVFDGGETYKIKKIVNGTIAKIKPYRPWVTWFWKIKVPRWMMSKLYLTFDNKWKHWPKMVHPTYCFIIWLGCEVSVGGDYGNIKNAFQFDLTILNFGIKLNIEPFGLPSYGIGGLII